MFVDVELFRLKKGDVEEDDHYLKHHKMKSKEVPLTTLTSSRGSEQLESLPPQPPPSESKWQQFKRRCPYYVPIFYWLPRYNFKRDFPRDLVAGSSMKQQRYDFVFIQMIHMIDVLKEV
jgi:hypothetical protein